MAGASAIFILDSKGKVILSRDYRGNVSLQVVEKFAQYLQEQEHIVKPVFAVDGVIYCWIQHRDIYLVGITIHNSNAMMIIIFLYRLANVLKDYFKLLEEESIRDNFVITYELLDEMMDDGYPQLTDEKILRQYIKSEAHQLLIHRTSSNKLPACVTNAVSWRTDNIRHKKNEIFLDVVEKLNMLLSVSGTVLRSEILGTLKMKSFLSGMPELKLGLNDKLQFELGNKNSGIKLARLVELEDIRFHQCVRLGKFETDRTISFIPPDGEFELMSYRLNTQVKPLIWVECIRSEFGRSRVDYTLKAKSNFKSRSVANDVEISIPVAVDVDTPTFRSAVGHVKYVPDKNVMVWIIKQFPGQKELMMSASFGFPTVVDESVTISKRPITVQFEIPYFTVSSITVRYLKIIEKSGYHALPWVRYITRNGDYQLRMS